MYSSATGGRIVLDFAWVGPTSLSRDGPNVGVVDLVIKGAKTEISVLLPVGFNPLTPRKRLFTCRKYDEIESGIEEGSKIKCLVKETHPESLSVTVEQIRQLEVIAGIFEKGKPVGPMIIDPHQGRIRSSDRKVGLEIPDDLEIGGKYSLVVTSVDLSLSAKLVKEEKISDRKEKEMPNNEYQRRVRNMGAALIGEGMRNLSLASMLASREEEGLSDSSASSADVFAHGMQGVIRAGQEVNPNIRVPYSAPTETSSDLDMLDAEELQARFNATFKKDKELESLRMRAAIAGNLNEMNRITEIEHANSQLLIKLSEALERKGIKAQIPQNEGFQAAARESADIHAEAINGLVDNCKMQ